MSDTPDPGTMPPGELIDRLCDEFENGWLEHKPARIEDVVASVPEYLRPPLFRELLAVERAYREKDGRPVTAAEARSRFAGLGPWAEGVIQESLAGTGSWAEGPPTPPPGHFSAALTPPSEPVPESVGKYRVVRKLGGGGMGVVYLARDPDGHREVAVKVMRAHYAADATARGRFLREARSAMAVEHDHVVPIYQVEENGDAPFLVMPVLKGESLEERLARDPLPPPALIIKVGREVAEGLAAAHARGLVHRDAKPANTWLEGDPAAGDPAAQVRRVKVLDFGLARAVDRADGVSVTGSVVGTPAYMAPEQARGQKVDCRSDLFSLGAILYQMAVGRRAFEGDNFSAVLMAVATHNPDPPVRRNPAIPPALSDLIIRLLEKEPAKRPASARDVADALAAIETGKPLSTQTANPRRKWLVALAAVLLLGGVGAWLLTRPADDPGGEAKGDRQSPEPPPAVAPVPSAPILYKGSVDLLVHRKDPDGSDVAYPLSDVRAWPLKPGDDVKVTAEVDPPAYVYLFWIDETGAAYPLYPWTPLKWGTRPAAERKVGKVEVKDPNGNWFKIGGKDAGMETLQMLARPEPLAATEEEIQGWFRGLRPLAFAGEKARTWFQGFDLVKHDPTRAPEYGGEMGQEDGPLGLQAVLGKRIGSNAGFSRAVSFARLGKKGSE